MVSFVEGALALELPLSKCYFFQTPLSSFLFVLLSSLQVLFIMFQAITSLLGTGVSTERVELMFGLAFEIPTLLFLSFFSIILLFFLAAAAINLWAFNPSFHERMDHDPLTKFSSLRRAPGWKMLSMVGNKTLPL
jgi:hypothetical protein